MNFSNIIKHKWIYQSCIFVFFILCCTLRTEAQEINKEKITISVKSQSVKKVFDEISRQTGIRF